METLGKKRHYTIEEYHQVERETGIKYEYHQGEIFAMAGGEPEHAFISVNITSALSVVLNGRPCRIGNSDLKIRIEKQDRTFYPDVSVFCDKPIRSEKESVALTNPILLVEVLSEGTEAYDRGAKFDFYSAIPSLKAYLLVESERKAAQLFQRDSENSLWQLEHFHEGDEIIIESLDVKLSLNGFYTGVDLEEKQ